MTYEIPQSVRVGPFNLDIKFVDDVAEKLNPPPLVKEESVTTYGCLNMKDLAIYLANDQKEGITADTLLHEILHAIWAVSGGWAYTEADEERIISMITGTLLDTFKRNKDLTRYLFKNDD